MPAKAIPEKKEDILRYILKYLATSILTER
jgi:hypothetical protein